MPPFIKGGLWPAFESLERWRQVRQLTVHAHVGGELWGRRGQEGILNDARIELDPHAQHLVFHGFTASRPNEKWTGDMTAVWTIRRMALPCRRA